jgi:hypothetical protein
MEKLLIFLALIFTAIEVLRWIWRFYIVPAANKIAERPFLSIGVVVIAVDFMIHIH